MASSAGRRRGMRPARQRPRLRERRATEKSAAAIVLEALPDDAAADVEDLKRRTIRECADRFERRWGAPFQNIGTTGDGGRNRARTFMGFWEAENARLDLEAAARVLYEAMRKGDPDAFRGADALLMLNPFGSGGIALAALYAARAGHLPIELPTLAELADRYPKTKALVSDRDGRALFVETFGGAIPWLGGAVLTNRELAEILILCGGANTDDSHRWAGYARRIRLNDPVRPVDVIDDEEKRVRRVRR